MKSERIDLMEAEKARGGNERKRREEKKKTNNKTYAVYNYHFKNP